MHSITPGGPGADVAAAARADADAAGGLRSPHQRWQYDVLLLEQQRLRALRTARGLQLRRRRTRRQLRRQLRRL